MQTENNNSHHEVIKGLSLVATILALIVIPNAIWDLINTVRKMSGEPFNVDRARNLSIQIGLLAAAFVMFFKVMPAMRKRSAQNTAN